jgi:hypothetical protein
VLGQVTDCVEVSGSASNCQQAVAREQGAGLCLACEVLAIGASQPGSRTGCLSIVWSTLPTTRTVRGPNPGASVM